MYQIFPSYGSFAAFIIFLTVLALLSIYFQPQLNAFEDRIRDAIEAKYKNRKE